MPISMPVAFLLGILLESLLLGGLALWFGCRFLSISGVTLRRAIAVNLASVVLAALFFSLSGWAIVRAASWCKPGSLSVVLLQLAVASAACLGMAAAQVFLLAKLLGAQWLKAFAAWTVMNSPTVIINLVLAVFARAILVEPFIVPTGSMAPTILGVHADRACKHCGYPFAASLSSRLPRNRWDEERSPESFPTLVTACPNCRRRDVIGNEVPQRRGDQILVDKRHMPGRWEIGVFRYPENRKINFVQRIVGLPGETIEIVAGEVFADGKRLTKPPAVAQELWVTFHDTAFRAETAAAGEPGWRPGKNATWHEQQGLWIGGDDEQPSDALDYWGPITNFNAYNAAEPLFAREHDEYEVGDVLTTCDIASLSGPGKFGMRWRFGADAVDTWLSASGAVEINVETRAAQQPSRDRLAGALKSRLKPGDRIAFAIRDGQAYVVHNDEVALLLPFGSPDIDHAKLATQEPAAPCRLSLVADRCRVSLSRIVLVRDAYYTGGDVDDADDVSLLEMRGARDRPVTLGAMEYFSLGDNSAFSKDSRMYGDLQAADMIGTARWIYWPEHRWHAFR